MQPLSGKRILITRPLAQAKATAERVRRRGGIPVIFPCMAVECLPENIRHGLEALKQPHSEALFTSGNGVDCVAQLQGERFALTFADIPVAAVGRKTAARLKAHGIHPSLTPETASQEGLLAAYAAHLPARLVFFRAEEGRKLLAQGLEAGGVDVVMVHAYRTICPNEDASEVIRIDAVLLGSEKTARHYLQRIGDTKTAALPVAAAISPKVAECATTLKLNVQVVAKEASFDAMLDGLEQFFRNRID
jgi:uroporphyrinogen-III synthase